MASKVHRGTRGSFRNRESMNLPKESQTSTCLFTRTKMCKFHLLGICSKGASCQFAHSPAEMNPLPDLFRTKLCRVLINTGGCDDPTCKYAHNKEELRTSATGDKPWRRHDCKFGRSSKLALDEVIPKQPNGEVAGKVIQLPPRGDMAMKVLTLQAFQPQPRDQLSLKVAQWISSFGSEAGVKIRCKNTFIEIEPVKVPVARAKSASGRMQRV